MDPILMSAREAQVVTLLFSGLNKKEISVHMRVSVAMVNYHLHRVYKKAGVSCSIELVAKAWKNGGFLY